MKTLFKTKIYALLFIIGLFIFSTLIINTSLFDEKLDSRVATIIKASSPAPSVEGNAYFALMGISAAAGKDITHTGLELIMRYMQNREHGDDSLNSDDYQEILAIDRQIDNQWLDRYDNCTSRKEYGCLGKLSKQLLITPIDGERLSLMLQRYDHIMQMSSYQNLKHISHGSPMPRYGVILKLSQLKLAELYNSAEKIAFLSQIAKELDFWKMQLTSGTMIIDKMVAVAGIRNNLSYLSEFMLANLLSEQEYTVINSLLIPLNQAELDISEGFVSESRTMFQQIEAKHSTLFVPSSMLLQPHATMNMVYQYFTEPMVSLNQMKLEEFIHFLHSDNNNQRRKQVESLLSFTPDSLYNYNGKTFISANYCLNCQDYIARMHDINNMMNLLKLQLSLKINGKTATKQVVLNSEVINPYTSKAYDFDSTGNWLQFDCLDPSSKCRIKL